MFILINNHMYLLLIAKNLNQQKLKYSTTYSVMIKKYTCVFNVYLFIINLLIHYFCIRVI